MHTHILHTHMHTHMHTHTHAHTHIHTHYTHTCTHTHMHTHYTHTIPNQKKRKRKTLKKHPKNFCFSLLYVTLSSLRDASDHDLCFALRPDFFDLCFLDFLDFLFFFFTAVSLLLSPAAVLLCRFFAPLPLFFESPFFLSSLESQLDSRGRFSGHRVL